MAVKPAEHGANIRITCDQNRRRVPLRLGRRRGGGSAWSESALGDKFPVALIEECGRLLMNSVGEFDRRERDRRSAEGLQAQHRSVLSLDRAVALLDDVVQMLSCSYRDQIPPEFSLPGNGSPRREAMLPSRRTFSGHKPATSTGRRKNSCSGSIVLSSERRE